MDLAALGERIVRLRESNGDMSRVELARAAGVSYTFLQQLENGVGKEPGAKKLADIAAILGVTLDSLISGSADSGAAGAESRPDRLRSAARREIDQILDGLGEEDLQRVRDLLQLTMPQTGRTQDSAVKVSALAES